ncbi:hypothetical protein [Streptomyces sp. PsTaAH-124]|uniref:hypothetical protein n=1 Tax=Streptomyces sp. PsTaAH-124 TaxID=1157638 RepID=UPI00036C6D6B|nr:hypothetical protein [Streptomyces sp. PsTaAH-124]
MAKRIEVPVDDAAYAALEAEAERVGITVPELVGQVVTHDVHRRRFLTAAQHYVTAWGPAFDAEFGTGRPDGAAA